MGAALCRVVTTGTPVRVGREHGEGAGAQPVGVDDVGAADEVGQGAHGPRVADRVRAVAHRELDDRGVLGEREGLGDLGRGGDDHPVTGPGESRR